MSGDFTILGTFRFTNKVTPDSVLIANPKCGYKVTAADVPDNCTLCGKPFKKTQWRHFETGWYDGESNGVRVYHKKCWKLVEKDYNSVLGAEIKKA